MTLDDRRWARTEPTAGAPVWCRGRVGRVRAPEGHAGGRVATSAASRRGRYLLLVWRSRRARSRTPRLLDLQRHSRGGGRQVTRPARGRTCTEARWMGRGNGASRVLFRRRRRGRLARHLNFLSEIRARRGTAGPARARRPSPPPRGGAGTGPGTAPSYLYLVFLNYGTIILRQL